MAVAFDDDWADVAPDGVPFPDAIRYAERSGSKAVSPKGAKGEMQVLDSTNLDPGFGVTPAADQSDDERERVGRDYADALLKHYGNPWLASAAYNAGPGRVDDWLKEFGDPRKGEIDMDQFLKKVPFQETRNYVQKVAQGLGTPADNQPNDWVSLDQQSTADDWQPLSAAPQRTFAGNVGEFFKQLVPGAATTFTGMGQGLAPFTQQGAYVAEDYQKAIQNWNSLSPFERNKVRQKAQTELPSDQNFALQNVFEGLNKGLTPEQALASPTATVRGAQPHTTKTEDTGLYQFSTDLQNRIQNEPWFKPKEGYETSPGAMLGQATGSMLSAVPVAMTPAGIGGTAALFSLSQAGQQVQDAIEHGATEGQIMDAAAVGSLPGLTDSLPIELLVGHIPVPGVGFIKVPPGMLGNAMKVVGRIGLQAFAEGFQEGGQQWLQNMIARVIYNPDQPMWDQVPENAGAGGGAGAIAEAGKEALELLGGARVRRAMRRARAAGAPPEGRTPPGGEEPPAGTAGPQQPTPPTSAEAPAAEPPPTAPKRTRKKPAPTTAAEAPTAPGWEPFYDEDGETQLGWWNPKTNEVVRKAVKTGAEAPSKPPEAPSKAPEAAAAPETVLPKPTQEEPQPTEKSGKGSAQAFDFEKTFPSPDDERQHEAGRSGYWDEIGGEPAEPERTESLAASHEEYEREGANYIGALTAADEMLESGVDPKTGKKAKGAALERLRKEAEGIRTRAPQDFDDHLGAYADVFGEKAADAWRDHLLERYDENGKMRTALDAIYAEGTRAQPVKAPETAEAIEPARQQVNPEPTEAQKEAGNYQKGHVQIHGLDITIETPKGRERRGPIDEKTGEPKWVNTHPTADYGYVKRTEGADGEQVDVYVGPNPQSDKAFVVDQFNPKTGKFDEHKPILGADSAEQAAQIYDDGFSDGSGPKRRGKITEMPVSEFRDWLKKGNTTEELAPQVEAQKLAPPPVDEKALTDFTNRIRRTGSAKHEGADYDVIEEAAKDGLPRWVVERSIDDGERETVGEGVTEEHAIRQAINHAFPNRARDVAEELRAESAENQKRREELQADLKTALDEGRKTKAAEIERDLKALDARDKAIQREILSATHEDLFAKPAPEPEPTAESAPEETAAKEPEETKPQALKFERLGDFMEFATADRAEAAKVGDALGVANTKTAHPKFEGKPWMVGVPVHAWEQAKKKLADAGYAVTEPEEPPTKEPKKTKSKKEPEAAPTDKRARMPKFHDVGEAMPGKRAAAKEKVEKAKDLEVLLEQTREPTRFQERLAADATTGAQKYAMDIGRGFESFLEKEGDRLGGGRRKWSSSYSETLKEAWASNPEKIREHAAEYIAAMESLGDVLAGAKDVNDVHDALKRAVYGEKKDFHKEYDRLGQGPFKDAGVAIGVSSSGMRREISFHKWGSEGKERIERADLPEALKPLADELFEIDAKEKRGGYTELGKTLREYSRGYGFSSSGFDIRSDSTAPYYHQNHDKVPDRATPLVRPSIAVEDIRRENLPERRKPGENITAEKFQKTFGFRGVEFGNWVTGREGQAHVNAAYDALLDFAETMNMPASAISLGGKLGLAFGSRGKGRHSAHYEPDTNVINLTKTKGDGSVAHEWAHALDYNLRGNAKRIKEIGDAIATLETRLHGGKLSREDFKAQRAPLSAERDELQKAYRAAKDLVDSMKSALTTTWDPASALAQLDRLLLGTSFIQDRKSQGPIKTAQEYVQWLWKNEGWGARRQTNYKREADKLGKGYWGNPEELWARSFEAMIFDRMAEKGQVSPYLVNDWVQDSKVTKEAGYRGTPYPTEAERKNFAIAWKVLLDQLQWNDDGTLKAADYKPVPNGMEAVAEALGKVNIEERWAQLQKEKRDAGERGRLQAESGKTSEAAPPEGISGPEGERRPAPEGERSGERDRGAGEQPTTASEPGRAPGAEAAEGEHGQGAGGERGAEGIPAAGREGGEEDRPERGLRGLNFRISEDANYATGSARTRIEKNIQAIRVALDLDKNGQLASKEDQEQLAHYVGWGATDLAKVFGEGRNLDYSYKPYQDELKALLTPAQYEAANATVTNAHYTSQDVVRGIWDAMQSLGFDGDGAVLEPGMGIGNFIGMRPEEAEPKFVGVEKDDITGKIARGLYPASKVLIQPFEETVLPEGSFDAVVGNVPFANLHPADKRYNKGRKLSLHNYFIFKSLKLLKPGGIMGVVTSRYTMDAQSDEARRMFRDAGADLIGAIRLPNTAFKQNAGTQGVTDILFFRKRKEGEAPAGDEWLQSKKYKVGDGHESFNRYFKDNPKNVLGEPALIRGQHQENEYSVVGPAEGLRGKINKAVEKILKDSSLRFDAEEGESQNYDDIGAAPADVKDNAFFEKDGKIFQKIGGVAMPAELAGTQVDRVKSLIKLRDKAREVLGAQREDWDGKGEAPWVKPQKELGKLYDQFVKKFGYINQVAITKRTMPDGEAREYRRYPNLVAFRDDPDAALVSALERFNEEEDKGVKAPIFTERVAEPFKDITKVDTPEEALIASMNMKGGVDLPYMAKLLGRPVMGLSKDLAGRIYKNPANATWELAELYLAGNVRSKLAVAKQAAAVDDLYQANVAALEAVQPEDLKPSQIGVRLGAPWIPNSDVEDFGRALLDSPVVVKYVPSEATWHLTMANEQTAANQNTWAVNYTGGIRTRGPDIAKTGLDLLNDLLNQRTTIVQWRDSDGITHTDTSASIVAQQKQNDIKERFAEWLWKDPDRGARLAKFYNENFNNLRIPAFDGSHLTLPGSSSNIKLRSTQLKAIWRFLVSGNTLLDHRVGAGKTFTAIAAAMEAKRLGLLKKPLFSVPNYMLEQFSREFMQLYPNANIIVADDRSFAGENRRRFVGRVAAGNWDAVIMTHSSFERVQMSPAYQQDYLRREIAEYVVLIQEAKKAAGSDKGRDPTVKQLEAAKARREAKLTELLQAKDKDKGVTFEEMGVDGLFIDEAHLFKNLEFPTKINGLSASSSQRATDLYLKTRYINQMSPGRGIMFMTGTPISNSMAEMYTMQRYLQPQALAERGISHFDAWASTFGDTVTRAEIAPEGGRARLKTRFAKFRNLPELLSLYRQFADYVSRQDLIDTGQITLPAVKQHLIEVPPSDELTDYITEIGKRADDIRSGKVKKDEDNMLKVSTDGRKASLDMRLVRPELRPAKIRKATAVADNMAEVYKQTAPFKGTQLAFIDLSVPKAEGYSFYRDLKQELIRRGVKADDIAFIHDADTDQKKANLFADVRAGKKRILLGSTEKMGMGVNVQKLLYALHHVDPQWRPSDIEQREGRIERQGNENPEVHLYRYVTVGSFDAYMWQTVERKAHFINAAKKGDLSIREMEDLDEDTLSYAEAKALAAGNPMLLEKATIDARVDQLSRVRAAHNDNIRQMEWELSAIPDRIARDEAQRTNLEVDQKTAAENEGKYTIGGERYAKRPEAAKALGAILTKAHLAAIEKRKALVDAENAINEQRKKEKKQTIVMDGLTRWGRLEEPIRGEVGTIGGFKATYGTDGVDVWVNLTGKSGVMNVGLNDEALETGAMTRVENEIGNIPKRITAINDSIEHLQKRQADFEELVKVPFAKEKEYRAAVERQRQVDLALGLTEPTLEDKVKALDAREAELDKRHAAGEINRYQYLQAIKPIDAERAKLEGVEVKPYTKEERTTGFILPSEPGTINLGEAGEDTRMQVPARPQPAFFSGLERAVEAMPQAKMGVGQWRNTLKNMQGLKKDELDWVGLDEWLQGQTGNLDKDKIVDFIRANNVQIKEVLKGAPQKPAPTSQELADNPIRAQMTDRYHELSDSRERTPGENRLLDWMEANPEATDIEYLTREYDIWLDDHRHLPRLSADELAMELTELKRTRRRTGPEIGKEITWLHDYGNRWQDAQETQNNLAGGFDENVEFPTDKDEWALTSKEDDTEVYSYGTATIGLHYGEDGEINYASVMADSTTDLGDFNDWDDAVHHLREFARGTKYPSYTLPGGANYREMLLTLPSRGGELKVVGHRDDGAGGVYAKRGAEGDFHSGHWDEPNIIAHIRFNDRTDADGKKTLFIEEIQSDWHQLGRKEGYGETIERTAPHFEVEDRDGRPVTMRITRADAEQFVRDSGRDDLTIRESSHVVTRHPGVPNAPFKTTWQELAFKRMLRYAAENGYDQIAWTTGAQQADRYDLSRHIGSITLHDNVSGGIAEADLEGAFKGGNLIARDTNGREVLNRHVDSVGEIAEVVGQELADKLMAVRPVRSRAAGLGVRERKLSGLDVQVGGEGMRGFYDKILPAFANKYAKKWDAKVGETIITREGKDYGWPVHSLPITPKMRDSVMQGQPLFQNPRGWESADVGGEGTGRTLEGLKGKPVRGTPLEEISETEKGILEDVDRIMARIAPTAPVIPMRTLTVGGYAIKGAAFRQGVQHVIGWAMSDWENKPRSPESVASTVRHETLHWLRTIGFFSPREWGAMEAAARKGDWIRKHQILTRYQGFSPETQIEEAIAEEFPSWAARQQGEPTTALGRAFDKLRRLLRQVASAMRKRFGNNTSADDIFRKIESGEIGARTPNPEWARKAQQQSFQFLSPKEASQYAAEMERKTGKIWSYTRHEDENGKPYWTASTRGLTEVDIYGADERAKKWLAEAKAAAEAEARTKAFKEWFGKSKIVTSDGKPKLVYHGTTENFSQFAQTGDIGFHFGAVSAANKAALHAADIGTTRTERWQGAWRMAGTHLAESGAEGLNIIPAYLKIEKPLRLPDLFTWEPEDVLRELADRRIITRDEADEPGTIVDRDYVQQALNDAGYDGIVYRNEAEGGGDSYIVFDPAQIKSPFNEAFDIEDQRFQAAPLNPFSAHTTAPDPTVVDYLTDSNLSLMTRLKGATSFKALNASLDNWREGFQDRFIPLLRVQQAIERMRGGRLAEAENTYQAEELSSGRKGAKLEDLATEHVEPLINAMKELGIGQENLEAYLYARHAQERNERIRDINPEFRDNPDATGSGMSDEAAQAILDAVRASGRQSDYDALAGMVDRLLAFAVNERVESGLMSEDDAQRWRDTYEHYVPLRGKAELDPELENTRPRTGGRFRIRGKESYRAFGRNTPARDILAYSVMQAEEAIIRGENNRIAQSLYELAKSTPDPTFWKVDPVTRRPVFNKATGQVEYQAQRRVLAVDEPYTISLKIDGKEHRVILNKDNQVAQRLAKSLKGLRDDQIGRVIQTFGTVNRMLSHVNTTLNPEFVITNAFRDLQEAMGNLQQYDIAGITEGTLKDYFPAMKAATRSAFRNETGGWGDWAREFRQNGGRVYFNRLETVADIRKRLARELKAANSGPSVFKALHTVGQFIEKVNMGVENAIRLSAYKNARERGLTPAQAASLAKNLTINFNRRGSWGPLMNALYLFYNASVQGTATLLTAAAKSSRVRKVLGSAAILGFLVEMLNALAGDRDKDDELYYDKISPYDKERNLILMDPFSDEGRFYKIPLPYGYGAFYGMGRSVAELARGKKPLEVAGNLFSAIIDTFNPVGGYGSILNIIAPTIFDPVVDLASNRDFAGRPIAPEQNKFGAQVPNSQRYWDSISPQWKAVTDALNKISGGDEVTPGLIDLSPEWLDYLFGQVTGAAGAFYQRNLDLMMKLFDPSSEITFNDIPMARRVVGNKPSWYDKAMFYERANAVMQARADVKEYSDRGENQKAIDYQKKNKDLLNLYNFAQRARDALSDVRKDRAHAVLERDQGKITTAEYRNRLKVAREKEDEAVAVFNKAYLGAVLKR